jgi:hypothetical protein
MRKILILIFTLITISLQAQLAPLNNGMFDANTTSSAGNSHTVTCTNWQAGVKTTLGFNFTNIETGDLIVNQTGNLYSVTTITTASPVSAIFVVQSLDGAGPLNGRCFISEQINNVMAAPMFLSGNMNTATAAAILSHNFKQLATNGGSGGAGISGISHSIKSDSMVIATTGQNFYFPDNNNIHEISPTLNLHGYSNTLSGYGASINFWRHFNTDNNSLEAFLTYDGINDAFELSNNSITGKTVFLNGGFESGSFDYANRFHLRVLPDMSSRTVTELMVRDPVNNRIGFSGAITGYHSHPPTTDSAQTVGYIWKDVVNNRAYALKEITGSGGSPVTVTQTIEEASINISGNNRVQTFTATASGTLDLSVWVFGTTTTGQVGTFQVEILNSSNAVLATSNTLDYNTTTTLVPVTFSTPFTVTNGALYKYKFVSVSGSGARTRSTNASGDVYAGGVYETTTTRDLTFTFTINPVSTFSYVWSDFSGGSGPAPVTLTDGTGISLVGDSISVLPMTFINTSGAVTPIEPTAVYMQGIAPKLQLLEAYPIYTQFKIFNNSTTQYLTATPQNDGTPILLRNKYNQVVPSYVIAPLSEMIVYRTTAEWREVTSTKEIYSYYSSQEAAQADGNLPIGKEYFLTCPNSDGLSCKQRYTKI